MPGVLHPHHSGAEAAFSLGLKQEVSHLTQKPSSAPETCVHARETPSTLLHRPEVLGNGLV